MRPDVRALLGDRIRERRAELDFTQEGFAHYTGLARTYYGRIKWGQQNVTLERLVWLAAHLETSVADLTRDLNADVRLAFVEAGHEVD
ncbi:helix-turn-helix domain-containing protein [Sphingomonas arvum]|uniref:helix-turn-helix domain-containing protein n=1 Tax=Sphingomonas arvum TaxID=2992113 RepID=UPI0038B2BB9A